MNDDLSQWDLGVESETYEDQVAGLEALIRQNLTFEQVTHHLAKYIVLGRRIKKQMAEMQALTSENVTTAAAGIDALASLSESALDLAESTQEAMSAKEAMASSKAKAAANALHDKPGGTRSKRDAIRAIWASGKYKDRSLCAEQECAALDMSYDAARKALRNTPKAA